MVVLEKYAEVIIIEVCMRIWERVGAMFLLGKILDKDDRMKWNVVRNGMYRDGILTNLLRYMYNDFVLRNYFRWVRAMKCINSVYQCLQNFSWVTLLATTEAIKKY